MKGRLSLFAALALLLPAPLSFPDEVYLELDQMLCLKIGLEHDLAPRWGVKGSLGLKKTGILRYYEFQWNRGWRVPLILPEIGLEFIFTPQKG